MSVHTTPASAFQHVDRYFLVPLHCARCVFQVARVEHVDDSNQQSFTNFLFALWTLKKWTLCYTFLVACGMRHAPSKIARPCPVRQLHLEAATCSWPRVVLEAL